MHHERSSRILARDKGSFPEVTESDSTDHTSGVLPRGVTRGEVGGAVNSTVEDIAQWYM